MTTRPKASTLPSYKYIFPSEVASAGLQVSSAGDYTAKDSWALVPGGVSPANLTVLTAVAPNTATIKGQNAAASFASIGGNIILSPGTGSIGNTSGNVLIQDTAGNCGWNTAHLRLGIYHIWVSAAGKLYIKNSAPTTDTDGTIIGTQT